MSMMGWLWKGKEKKDPKKGKEKEGVQEQNQEEMGEEQLQKKGFDPDAVETEQVKQEAMMDFDKDYEEFINPSAEQIDAIVAGLKFFQSSEEHRHALAYSSGGKICGDKKVVNKIRSIGKEMIKLIGKKIISGDMNLTRVSFPIKVMVPKTALENSTMGGSTLPLFMRKACETQDPVEKMKYTITAIISSAYYMNMFLKPLNPVIGETLQGEYPDGTKIYCEQISHHPPISYFLFVGPKCSYRYSGYYAFEANAGLNSMTLTNKGKRVFEFSDGTVIQTNFPKEVYGGVFLGSLRSESIGSLILKDNDNNLSCEIKYGKVKKKPSDFLQGEILKDGQKVSSIFGTYCGFLEFDGIRYWDGRHIQGIKINFDQNPLESDFRNRSDLTTLKTGDVEKAQVEKEKGEEMQRRDVKLRQKFKNQKD